MNTTFTWKKVPILVALSTNLEHFILGTLLSSYQREVADVCLFSSSVCEFLWSLQDWPLSWSNTAVASFFHRFPLPSRAFPRSSSSLNPDFAPIPLFKFWARTLKLISPDHWGWAPLDVESYSRRALTFCNDSSQFDLSFGQEQLCLSSLFLVKCFRRSSDQIWEFDKKSTKLS